MKTGKVQKKNRIESEKKERDRQDQKERERVRVRKVSSLLTGGE